MLLIEICSSRILGIVIWFILMLLVLLQCQYARRPNGLNPEKKSFSPIFIIMYSNKMNSLIIIVEKNSRQLLGFQQTCIINKCWLICSPRLNKHKKKRSLKAQAVSNTRIPEEWLNVTFHWITKSVDLSRSQVSNFPNNISCFVVHSTKVVSASNTKRQKHR